MSGLVERVAVAVDERVRNELSFSGGILEFSEFFLITVSFSFSFSFSGL